MNWRNLMDTARQIVGHTEPQPRGRPRQELLKAAVNRAYYAMFHALCQNNADALVGRSTDATTRLAWTRTYRSLDHRLAMNRLTRARSEILSPARSFAATFAALQEQRHAADYDPHSRFARSEVIELLDTVETVTESFLQMPRRERKAVAVLVLMQERPTG